MSSKFLTLQQEIADELIADPRFQYVPVLIEKLQDIEGSIEVALGALTGQSGKSGICVVALTPTANVTDEFQNVFGPVFNDGDIVLTVLENVVVNQNTASGGTGIHALEVVEWICNRLHMFRPFSGNGPLIAAKPTFVLIPPTAENPNLMYHVLFKGMVTLSDVPPQVATPVAGQNTFGLFWNFLQTGAVHPPSGLIYANAAIGAVTSIKISAFDQGGTDRSSTIEAFAPGTRMFLNHANGSLTAVITSVTVGSDPGTKYYDVVLVPESSSGSWQTPMTLFGVTMTLSSATAGASIWITVNQPGSTPIPRSHTLYSGPRNQLVGDLIRAKAWLSGYIASEILQEQITD